MEKPPLYWLAQLVERRTNWNPRSDQHSWSIKGCLCNYICKSETARYTPARYTLQSFSRGRYRTHILFAKTRARSSKCCVLAIVCSKLKYVYSASERIHMKNALYKCIIIIIRTVFWLKMPFVLCVINLLVCYRGSSIAVYFKTSYSGGYWKGAFSISSLLTHLEKGVEWKLKDSWIKTKKRPIKSSTIYASRVTHVLSDRS